MNSARFSPSIQHAMFVLGVLLIALMTWASTASAASTTLKPPRSLTGANWQINYWRTQALKSRTTIKTMRTQRNTARVKLKRAQATSKVLRGEVESGHEDVTAAIHALGGTDDLAAIVASINATLGGTGSTFARAVAAADTSDKAALAAQISDANAALGGTGTLAERVTAVNGTLGGSGTTLARADVAAGGSAALATQIADASDEIGGTGTLADRITALGTTLGASGTLTARAAAANTGLGGSGSIEDRVSALNATLNTTATTVTGGLDEIAAVLGGTGLSINARVINIRTSLTAAPTNITADLATVRNTLGGSQPTLEARINGIRGRLLVTPGTSLGDDVNTVRNLIVNTPSVTVEDDIRSIAVRLNGIAVGSTIESRIGNPAVNSTQSSLAGMLGGSESTLAELIGDPTLGDTGLAALMTDGNAVGIVNDFDANSFDNAASLYGKLEAVPNIFSQSDGLSTNSIIIPKGQFLTVGSMLAALNHD